MLNVSLIGFGAIGSGVAELLRNDVELNIASAIVTPGSFGARQDQLREVLPGTQVITRVEASRVRPDLLVECAGHGALKQHVLPALEQGIPTLVVSVGALAEPGMAEALEQAARVGKTQVHLLAGAIGAIDALAAARVGGLDSVIYTGTKPALAWQGTPAAENHNLTALATPTVIFDGTARDAARLYPKNANVAATVSLAGLGLDRTQVRLIADPAATENMHEVTAQGSFGSFELVMRGRPLASNPKTSALTVYSVVRAIRNWANALSI